MKKDLNEGIVNITYDSYLKQPLEIKLTDGRWIKYTYNGGGDLLKTEYSTGEYWEQIHDFTLKNGIQYSLVIPEGRAIWKDSTWKYEYQYTDHLGNTRVSFMADSTGKPKITAQRDFDPWGLELKTGIANTFQNRFELQGKEKESTFGLNLVNFGARYYNATLGRFLSSDALSERFYGHSPYNFSLNNPMRFIDPDGNSPLDIVIRGTDQKEWRVKTAGEDIVFNAPFALKNNAS